MTVKGKVKWFNEQKGYGFIQVDEGRDVFIHFGPRRPQQLLNLAIGQEIEYDPATDCPEDDSPDPNPTPKPEDRN